VTLATWAGIRHGQPMIVRNSGKPVRGKLPTTFRIFAASPFLKVGVIHSRQGLRDELSVIRNSGMQRPEPLPIHLPKWGLAFVPYRLDIRRLLDAVTP
jgi:hypothetical protein